MSVGKVQRSEAFITTLESGRIKEGRGITGETAEPPLACKIQQVA